MITHYSFELNKEMIYLIETLKVEGYWSSKAFTLTLQNKDIPLLNHIEKIVNDLKINVGKRLLLKIRLEDNTKKEYVSLIWKNKKLSFHLEKSPFDQNKIKAVTSLPHRKNYKIKLLYKNRESPIRIKILKNSIEYESELECWMYGDLRFPTKSLLVFLDNYCGGNKNPQVEKFLLKANGEIVMSAFSALVDCEGSIDYYGLYRKIRIRMRNYNYLRQWSELLKKYGIGNKLRKNDDKEFEISIYGWEDFDRLIRLGFKLHHSKKLDKWEKIMGGFKRNQISRNSYKKFYTNKLKEINKKVTAEEFSNYLNKSKRVVNHYLSKLEKEKLIERDRKHWPHLYFIST